MHSESIRMATNAVCEPLVAEARPLAAVASEASEGAAPTTAPVHKADKGENQAELSGDGSEEGRRTTTLVGAFARYPPKPREQLTAEGLRQALKKQVEYYFSDTNLETDAFFHGKMEEAERNGKGVRLGSGFNFFRYHRRSSLSLSCTKLFKRSR